VTAEAVEASVMDLIETRESELARLGERWLLIADIAGAAIGALIALVALIALLS
jgi:hypothetical protein